MRSDTILLLCLCSLLASAQQEGVSATEGDIIVEPSRAGQRFARQAMSNVWGQTPIPISFHSSYPTTGNQRAAAIAGMRVWEKYTCVRFNIGDTTSRDRVVIKDWGSCQSSVGRVGGVQDMSLGTGCAGAGTTSHELGHMLGLQHTQTRPDRDQFITIDKSNINPVTWSANFEVQRNSQSLGVPYDITSIMHYDPNAFTVDKRRPGIVPKPAFKEYAKVMGNFQLSFYDIMIINKAYKCDAKCSRYNTKCANGGVMDVNNCNQCLCPVAWGGRLCDQNPLGSQVLTATPNWQSVAGKVGSGQAQRVEHDILPYVINAPVGKRVEMKMEYIWTGDGTTECNYGGLEINMRKDSRFSGPRVCTMSLAEPSYKSEGNRMVLRLHGRFMTTQVNFSYRYIV